MPYSNKFRVPNYYKSFSCKGFDCRHTCCKGWDVSISMKEFFKTQSLNCSKKLRKIIDKTFYMTSHPTADRYAVISKNEHNDCPLHMENGYCMLHYECGENALPSICRYYPRGPRTEYEVSCSCSNSCEKVIELLIQDQEVITFEELDLSFEMPLAESRQSKEEKTAFHAIRDLSYTILTNRDMLLPRRIVFLGRVLQSIQRARDAQIPFNYESFSVDFFIEDFKIKEDPVFSFDIQKKLLLHFATKSPSIQSYSEQVFNYLNVGNEIEQYLNAKQHFYEIFPHSEIMFEKILMNHLIFVQFPFSSKYETLWDEFQSLCGVFLFIRFLSVCYMADKSSIDDFVDVISAAFRLIDHTNFDRNVALILKRENVTTLEQLSILIQA